MKVFWSKRFSNRKIFDKVREENLRKYVVNDEFGDVDKCYLVKGFISCLSVLDFIY